MRERERLGVGGCARRGRLGGARERAARGGRVVRGGGGWAGVGMVRKREIRDSEKERESRDSEKEA